MDHHPTVSVVIPTWNRAALIVEALASVVAQTYPHWEAIVVDDGSTDDTLVRIGRLGDPRIRVIASAHIGHIARLRNIGAAAACGEWIAFLDSDDRWIPTKLAVQMAAIGTSGAQWSYGDHALVDTAGVPIARRSGRFAPLSGSVLHALLAERTAASIVTLVVDRAVFRTLGGLDETLALHDDLDFELRLAAVANAVAIDEELVLVRDHPLRTTRQVADPHGPMMLVYDRLIARTSDAATLALAHDRLDQVALDRRRYRQRRRLPGRFAAALRRWAGRRSSR